MNVKPCSYWPLATSGRLGAISLTSALEKAREWNPAVEAAMSKVEELWLEGGGYREVYTDDYVEALEAENDRLKEELHFKSAIISNLLPYQDEAVLGRKHITALTSALEKARDALADLSEWQTLATIDEELK